MSSGQLLIPIEYLEVPLPAACFLVRPPFRNKSDPFTFQKYGQISHPKYMVKFHIPKIWSNFIRAWASPPNDEMWKESKPSGHLVVCPLSLPPPPPPLPPREILIKSGVRREGRSSAHIYEEWQCSCTLSRERGFTYIFLLWYKFCNFTSAV